MSSGQARHIYLHVPFCRRRCSYCDFSIAVRRDVPSRAFYDAILAELATRSIGRPKSDLTTLYLGGGTPSQLDPAVLGEIVAQFRHGDHVENSSTADAPFGGMDDGADRQRVEVTIEANPEDVTAAAARAWVAAGVNRVSLGVQSFDSAALAWMHRGHGAEGTQTAVGVLREAGVRNLSVDLIFGLPVFLRRDWARDLDLALALEPEHLSVYGLTVEPHTPLGRWRARGEVEEAPEESWADEFLEADRALTAAGFEHYEVSNYGRPGLHSRHNGAYWSGASYLGIGPSAHGFDGRERRWNVGAYAAWLAKVEGGMDPVEGLEVIGPAEQLAERVYLGLRTSDGLAIRQNELSTVVPWVEAGWGTLREDIFRLTATGWLRLDALATSLTSRRSHS